MENNTGNYCQVVEMTRDEKIKMYMKLTKREIAEMLVNRNDIINQLMPKTYNTKRVCDCKIGQSCTAQLMCNGNCQY